jgi:hypothetical protein
MGLLHGGGWKNRKCRISRSKKRSPDSESAHRELPKSGLASQFVPQTCDFIRNSGGGTTAGAPKLPWVRPRRNRCTTEALSRTPLSLMLLGEQTWDPVRDPDPQDKSDFYSRVGGPWRQNPRFRCPGPFPPKILTWGPDFELNGKCRTQNGSERSPDSKSARNLLQKSSLGSAAGPHNNSI